MKQLIKKRRNGNGSLFPSLRDDFFGGGLLTPRLFDFDEDFFTQRISLPLANITETNKEFKVDLSVPGMKRSDFKVDVDNGILTISSKKEEEKNENEKNYCSCEFSYSSFSRSFTLPDNVDENNINAKYDNGMLEITIPKKEISVAKPKKEIAIA
ncbi:MAG TPA: Hsp20/alpha crystallin family protein [Bacteroidia bacterium]|nr:Hsp20/alpha crystallin family protein [Bacteroidia bacterium]